MSLHPPHIIEVKRKIAGLIRGYLVTRNSQLTVVREFDGFSPAGFVAMPTSTVIELVINEPWTKMIASEGHANLAQVAPWFATNCLRTTLASIHERNVNVKFECENYPDSEEHGFHVGRIVALNDSSLEFVFFDATGRWFESAYPVPYTSITRVEVDNPYVTTFSRYIGPCPVVAEKDG